MFKTTYTEHDLMGFSALWHQNVTKATVTRAHLEGQWYESDKAIMSGTI